MEQAHSTTPISAANTRVLRGNSSIGASQMALMVKAWRKPLNPEVPVNWISSWVMPEKYQKNRNSQRNPAQSNLSAVELLRSYKAIACSSQKSLPPPGRKGRRRTGAAQIPGGHKGPEYQQGRVKVL
ncbi:hypothetical protein D3C84_763410 [compost metagenome]